MQIQVETLRHSLKLLQPVVPKKALLPAAQHVLVGEGRAVANNLEIAVALEVPEAVGDPLCFPPAALDFLERVPGSLMATAELANGKVAIAAGAQRASFMTVDAEDFPPIPTVTPEHEGVLEGEAFIRGLQAVAPYAGAEESRPVLTTVCLTLGDSPRLVTADGFRLAIEDLPGRLPGEGNLLIPRTAIKPLAYLWKEVRGTPQMPEGTGFTSLALAQRLIRLGWREDRAHLRLNWGEVTVVVQLPTGTFPDYSRLIPEKFQAHVTVLAEDLARTLAAMGRMARDNSSIVRLEWSPESGLQVTVKGEAGESVQMGVPGTCDPPEQAGRIAFNISYLEQYLKGKQGMVKISVYRESGPALLTYHGRGDHVLMPMFVAWDTPSPYPPEPEPEPAAAADTPPSVEPLATEPVDVGETGDAEVVYGDTTTEDIEVDTAPEAAVSEAPSAPADIPVDTAPAKPKRTRKAKAAKAA